MVIVCFFLSFFFSYLGSLAAKKYLKASFFLDNPDFVRKTHTIAIPRVGGIAFVFTIFALSFLFLNLYSSYIWYVMGGLFLFILGFCDDIFSLKWYVKLVVQVCVGSALFLFLLPQVQAIPLFGLSVPFNLFVFPFFMMWFLGFSNAVNLIDGLDGLAVGVMFIITFGLSVLGIYFSHEFFALLNMIFCGALGGFWLLNRYPAKLYMGDGGSLFLGYHLAMCPFLFVLSFDSYSFDLSIFFVMLTYFMWDTTRVFLIRLFNKSNPFKPDQAHFHFTLYALLGSSRYSVWMIYLINLIFIFLGFLLVFNSNQYALVSFMIYIMICLILFQYRFFWGLIGVRKKS